jgi:hypothetical protein
MMNDQEIINKCIELFRAIPGASLQAILKTDRAGDTVDNGMGVEFDLKPYYVLYRLETREVGSRSDLHNQASSAFYKSDLDHLISSDTTLSDDIEDDIERYRSVDDYNPIWITPDYKKVEPPRVTIEKHSGNISLKADRSYKMFISYDDLQRYLKDKKTYYYQCDLFSALIERLQTTHQMVDNLYFVTDKAKLKETIYTEKGIVFFFKISDTYEVLEGNDRLFFAVSDPNPKMVETLENKELISEIAKEGKKRLERYQSH